MRDTTAVAKKLERLYNARSPKPPACEGCPLREDGIGFAPPRPYRGEPAALVGSHAGEAEAYAGHPFVATAPTGRELAHWLSEAGFRSNDVWLANTIWCFLPARLEGVPRLSPAHGKFIGRDPTAPEARECSSRHLLPALRAVGSTLRLLITAGALSTRLLGDPKASTRAYGSLDYLPTASPLLKEPTQ